MFNIGDDVVLKHDSSKRGTINGNSFISDGMVIYPVKMGNHVSMFPKDELELYQDVECYDLPTLLSLQKFSTIDAVRRAIIQIRLNGNLSDMLYSMDITNTDFYAYQFKPVLKIINSASNGILIADEVGLGKTIEAGLIWTELRQRYNYKRLLVVCPSVLCQKWQDELKKRMGVKSEIVKADEVLRRIVEDDDYALICSLQGLANAQIEEKLEEISQKEETVQTDNKLINLLIVDEAHKMRNDETKSYKVGKYLRELADFAALLSATPIQNKNDDLYSMVKILDDINFPRKEYFGDIIESNKALVNLRDQLLFKNISKKEVLEGIENIYNNDIMGIFKKSKQLKALKQNVEQLDALSIEDRHKLAYELEGINSLGYIVSRTRKREVQEWRVTRDPKVEEIPMSEAENELYYIVTEAVRKYAQNVNIKGFEKFLLCTPQRMLTSSFYPTLMKWRQKNYNIDSEDEDNLKSNDISDFMRYIYRDIENFHKEDELYRNDTKFNRLLKTIKDLFAEYPNDKIVLFSTYIPTLEYLQKRLYKEDIDGILLSGQTKDKDAILKEFKENDKIKILLASEVGSEGVDLQFCKMLINYDLPWNPMRIEQRIGRLDRIGQKSEKILIWNMFHDSTIDARIYHKLHEKLNLVTSALGDFENLLGEKIEKLAIDLLLLTPEQQEERIEQTKNAIIENKRMNDQMEADASQLVAYGDYILQEIQKSKEQHRNITTSDLAHYVINSLKKFYKETTIRRANSSAIYEYSISVPHEFKLDLEEFCRERNIPQRTMFLSANPIECTFHNKLGYTSRRKENIDQFHPVIKFLSSKYANQKEQDNLVVAITTDNPVEKGLYLIFVSLVSASGLTKYEKLLYTGVDLNSKEYLETAKAERLLLSALSDGNTWNLRPELDYSDISDLSRQLISKNYKQYEKEVTNIKNKNYDRAELQTRTITKYMQKRKETYEMQRAKYEEKGNTKMIPALEGQFNRFMEEMEKKLKRIDRDKKIDYSKDDLCLVLLEVK